MRYPQNTIRFDDKPSDAVLSILRSWGFRWNRHARSWNAERSVESATVIDCLRSGETDPDRIIERVAVRRMEADAGIC